MEVRDEEARAGLEVAAPLPSEHVLLVSGSAHWRASSVSLGFQARVSTRAIA